MKDSPLWLQDLLHRIKSFLEPKYKRVSLSKLRELNVDTPEYGYSKILRKGTRERGIDYTRPWEDGEQ
jgi:hypothetical protein